MKNKLVYLGVLITLVFLGLPVTAWAADEPVGVAYRGHIQDRGDYPLDGSWIDSPEIIGTTGQSKRIEGFEIKLTGAVPADMELCYNVHVQNKGWLYDEDDCSDWPKDGAYAGTRGNSLRIEAVKIVLTDPDGQPLPGYSVQYRGHVQNIGDLPKAADQWLADGEQLGTVGSSLRLEALLVQVVKTGTDPVEPAEPLVYDAAGSYGPEQGRETIDGDVTVAADGVVLNNLVIAGSLTISEAVGDGNVTLNNVTVAGDTLVRGGGKNSIHINGGDYSRIVMEKTASGAVRIVATGVDGLDVVVAEDATGETIILEGAFASVEVNAPNMIVTTQGNTTTIGTMTVGAAGAGSTVTVNPGATVADLVLAGKAAVKGQGTVTKAEVKADGVVFDKKPGLYTVEPAVVIPPVFPPDGGGGGGGGGYTPPGPVAVTGVSLNKTSLELIVQGTETLSATVLPANATNKAVSFSSSDLAVATVDAGTGLVTAVAVGTAKITVTTTDGSKQASCEVTVDPIAVTSVSLTPATLNLVYEDTATLIAAVAPANATNQAVSFSSSNPAVASVNASSGEITAGSAGTATITVITADGGKQATSTVTVQGRLSIKQVKAVAGLDGNFVSLLLEGDTFNGSSSFDFDPGTTGLALGLPTSSTNNYSFDLNNTAAPGTLTLQATGLTSGVNSTTVSVTVLEPVTTFANTALTDATASFSWPDLGEATDVTLQQQKSGETSWSDATCSVTLDSTTATVTGLTPATTYSFRLIVTGGATPGVSNSVTVKTKPVATAVSLNQTTADLIMGNTLALTATVLPTNAVNRTVSWSSDKPGVATVDGNGVVSPVAPGTAVITATTANGFMATCALTVKPVIEATGTAEGVTITKYNGGTEPVVIPAEINSQPVIAIANGAFARTDGQVWSGEIGPSSVEIPATVKSIGNQAFLNCRGITTLTFAGSSELTAIGDKAFQGCLELQSVAIPGTVTSIGDSAFLQCLAMTSLDLGNVASIGANAFYQCNALTNLTIPHTVTSIGDQAFWCCQGLETVTFQGGAASTQTLVGTTFSDCKALKTVGFEPDTRFETLPANAFLGCSGLQRVIFSDALKTMSFNAFSGCPDTLVLRFYGDAPSNDTSAIPAGTTIEYLAGKLNFNSTRFPNCTIKTFTS